MGCATPLLGRHTHAVAADAAEGDYLSGRVDTLDLSVQTDIMDQEQLAIALAAEDPAEGLRAVLALRRLAEQVEAHQVMQARLQGWSWQQIGDALGITRQSVHAKYGKRGGP